MEEAPRYSLLSLLTLFSQFTLLTLLTWFTLLTLFICTIETALHCKNIIMYAYIYILLGKDRMLLEWAGER